MKSYVTPMVIVTVALSVVTTSELAADAQRSDYSYSYFKQSLPLKLDTGRIAVQQRAADPDAAPGVALEAFGIDVADRTPWPIAGWSLYAVPAASRDDAGIRGLVGRIAVEAGDVEFVSPVFLDEYGPIIITPDLLVGFEHGVSREQAEAILQASGAGATTDVDYSRMRNVYRFRSAARNGFEVLDAANALAQRPEIRFAEPDMIRTARTAGTIPTDPFFFRQWGLRNTGQNIFAGVSQLCCPVPCTGPCFPACPDPCISVGFGVPCDEVPGGVPGFDVDATEAWDITTGSASIIIVVCDEGVQLDHSDLMIDPALGMDFTGQGGGGFPVTVCDDHGTAVAGVIRAQMNNGIGVVGIAPSCRVAAARVIAPLVPCVGQQGVVSATAVINALAWAESLGARVTNHSYGMTPSAALTQKFMETRAAGLIHFAGAGNDGAPPVSSYPATLDNTVNAISSLEPLAGGLAIDSDYGESIDFAAPGQFIWTTDVLGDLGGGAFFGVPACNDWFIYSGTSFASPMAAGVAALILSVNPSLTPDHVEQIMRDSAIDLGVAGFDDHYGWGSVNAYNAVVKALPTPGDLNSDGDVDGFDLALLLGAWTGAATYAPCPPHVPADLNADCRINGFDLALLLGAWG